MALSWHGVSENSVNYGTSPGLNSAVFHFSGRTAHACGDPHNGRSVLDAVELMNVGANYLREHVPPDTRIHYVIQDGGLAPNIVPDKASFWYYVRALPREAIEEPASRLFFSRDGSLMYTASSGTRTAFFKNGPSGPERTFEVPFACRCMAELADGVYLLDVNADLARDERDPDSELCDEFPYRFNGVRYMNGTRSGLALYDTRSGVRRDITPPCFAVIALAVSQDGTGSVSIMWDANTPVQG